MSKSLNEIMKIEDKYGLMLFRMGLTYLIDVGVQHLTDDDVEKSIIQITKEYEAEKNKKGTPFMSLEFQCNIVQCAAELAKFSIWELIAYIKKHITTEV